MEAALILEKGREKAGFVLFCGENNKLGVY